MRMWSDSRACVIVLVGHCLCPLLAVVAEISTPTFGWFSFGGVDVDAACNLDVARSCAYVISFFFVEGSR